MTFGEGQVLPVLDETREDGVLKEIREKIMALRHSLKGVNILALEENDLSKLLIKDEYDSRASIENPGVNSLLDADERITSKRLESDEEFSDYKDSDDEERKTG